MTKEEIKEILVSNAREWRKELAQDVAVIYVDDFIEELLSKLHQPTVSGRSEQLFCEEHTPKVKYDWQKGNCLTCAKKLEAK